MQLMDNRETRSNTFLLLTGYNTFYSISSIFVHIPAEFSLADREIMEQPNDKDWEYLRLRALIIVGDQGTKKDEQNVSIGSQ